MARAKRDVCVDCGRHVDECGPLSRNGLCADDGERRVAEAVTQMMARSGPKFDKWRESMARSVGAEPPPTPPRRATG